MHVCGGFATSCAVAILQISQAFELARTHHQAGRLAEAEALYRQILSVQGDHPDSLHWLGYIAWQTGHSQAALELIQRAISLVPTDPAPHVNLGAVLASAGRPDEAINSFRQAITLQPQIAEAHCGLAFALYEKGDLRAAIAAFRQAIASRPDYAEALNNLGNALRDAGQLAEAIRTCRQAIDIQPGFAAAHCNLGNALKDAGLIAEAVVQFRAALRCDPRSAIAHSNLLLSLHYLAEPEGDVLFAEHRRWNDVHALPLPPFLATHPNHPSPDRPLRIAYISPDFRQHAVAVFFENLLAHHDPSEVEVFCYHDLRADDAVTARLRGLGGKWREIKALKDAAVAELIRLDGIDIAVDLAGHTAANRLLLFALRPAPIQVSYLGYCDTTGMPAMDYRLTDALADPPGATEHLHTETLFRLPYCAWSFRPPTDAPAIQPSPRTPVGKVNFGCFGALPKLTDASLSLWARIVLAVPGSQLLLKNPGFQEPETQARIRTLLQCAGLDPARVVLRPPEHTLAAHLATYHEVDIAFDTFPYHGTTTTCEALWMGVPVVTRAGRTHASRVGVSLLTNAGLPDLIAADDDAFFHRCVQLATDPTQLAELRSSLRERLISSPLMDDRGFARRVEAAYRAMWRAWPARV